jgi:mono/diheme cytochrome c family protein
MLMCGRNRLLTTTLFAIVILAQPAAAQNVGAGHRIAKSRCSDCHEIGKAQVQNVVSPPFAEIARMPSTTAISLNVFLRTPHNRMPDYRLTRREIADVSAYILSLK